MAALDKDVVRTIIAGWMVIATAVPSVGTSAVPKAASGSAAPASPVQKAGAMLGYQAARLKMGLPWELDGAVAAAPAASGSPFAPKVEIR